MSDSFYSIFHKVCPQCAGAILKNATQCACGYIFKQGGDEQLSPAQQALADEKLYEDYLAVRASQATQLAQTAEAAAQKTPQDEDKMAAARLAQENAERARLALHEQAQKVLQLTAVCRAEGAIAKRLKEAAAQPLAKPTVITAQAAQVAEAARALQAELAEMRAVSAGQTPRPAPKAKPTQAFKPEPKSGLAPPTSAGSTKSRISEPPMSVAASTPSAATTATSAAATQHAASTSTRAVASPPRRHHYCPSCGYAHSPAVIRCGCGQALRPTSLHRAGSTSVDWQRRAELVAHIQRLESHIANARRKREAAAAAARAQAKRKLAQKAEAVAQRLEAAKTKECFNCTAQVPLAATHCKCGFEFPAAAPSALMAEIALDPAERERVSRLFKKP